MNYRRVFVFDHFIIFFQAKFSTIFTTSGHCESTCMTTAQIILPTVRLPWKRSKMIWPLGSPWCWQSALPVQSTLSPFSWSFYVEERPGRPVICWLPISSSLTFSSLRFLCHSTFHWPLGNCTAFTFPWQHAVITRHLVVWCTRAVTGRTRAWPLIVSSPSAVPVDTTNGAKKE